MIDQEMSTAKNRAIDLLKENFLEIMRNDTTNGVVRQWSAADTCAWVSIELLIQAIGYGSTLTDATRDSEGYVTGPNLANALHDFISTRASIAESKGNPGIHWDTFIEEE